MNEKDVVEYHAYIYQEHPETYGNEATLMAYPVVNGEQQGSSRIAYAYPEVNRQSSFKIGHVWKLDQNDPEVSFSTPVSLSLALEALNLVKKMKGDGSFSNLSML